MVVLVALLSLFGMGVCFSLLGAISVKLLPRLNIDQGKFGTLITSFMSSCLVASLVIGVITDGIGFKPVATFGFALSAICILLFAYSRSYGLTLFSCLLLGFGAMAMNTVGNTLITRVLFGGKNAAAANNLGNVAFGVGLLLAPLLVSYLFRKTTYERTISVLAVIIAVAVVPALLADYPAAGTGFDFGRTLGMLSEPTVLLAGLALLCYAALDVSFSNWLPALGKEILTAARPQAEADSIDASAQRLISLYAVAMILGRLAASRVPYLTEYGQWFIAGASVAVALLLLWLTRTRQASAAWILVFVVGLLTAPFFPTIVGITFARFSPDVRGSVFGIIFAGALLGGATVPKAIGNLARGSSVQRSMVLLVPLIVALIILTIAIGYV
jgi:fucose permease